MSLFLPSVTLFMRQCVLCRSYVGANTKSIYLYYNTSKRSNLIGVFMSISREDLAKDKRSEAVVREVVSDIMGSMATVSVGNFSTILSSYELMFHQSCIIDPVDTQKRALIVQPFWLDSVHDSRLDTLWGQHVREYPRHIQALFRELNPGIDAQERVTFRQVKELRAECIRRLKMNPQYCILEGTCTSMELTEDRSHLTVAMTKDAKETISRFEVNSDTRVFNFSQKPRLSGLKIPPQTGIYTYPKDAQPKNIVVIGAGLSAVWLKEQSPGSNVTVALRSASSPLPPKIARNSVCIAREECVAQDEIDFLHAKDIIMSVSERDKERKAALLDAARNKGMTTEELVQDGVIVGFQKAPPVSPVSVKALGAGFCSLGFVPDEDFTSRLPKEMVIMPTPPSADHIAPKNLPSGAFFERYDQYERGILGASFCLYDTNLPSLVIRSVDKIPLSEALGVSLVFIDHLCNQIKALEDTPPDTNAYIKEVYKGWLAANSSELRSADFDDRLDSLFQNIESRSSYLQK